MAKVTKITARNGGEIVEGALEKLAAYAAELGLGVKQAGKWTYYRDGQSLELKIQFVVGGDEGIEERARADFNTFATYYGLEPQDFGAIITHRGKEYKLIGINTRRGAKYPYRFTEVSTGKEVSFTDMAKHAIIAARQGK